jgi:hypothetical protein
MRASLLSTSLFVVAAIPWLAGCPKARCPTMPHRDPVSALDALRSMKRPVRTLRAKARVEQRGGESGRIRGTVLMIVARPDRVRFDAMTQFGPAAILTSDGTRFALADLRENRYLSGPACPSNIARLLGIRMAGDEVARLLLGDTPRLDATSRSLACTGDGTYLVSLEGSDGRRQEVELAVRAADRDAPPEEQHLRLVRSQLFGEDGRTVWTARFEDYRVVPDPRSEAVPKQGVALPFEIYFDHARDDAEVRVRFQSIELNVEVPPRAFQGSPRPGMPSEVVPCEGGRSTPAPDHLLESARP